MKYNPCMIDVPPGKESLLKGWKFIDLFAGIGGFRFALEPFGAKCVFSSEWDKPCQKTYEANHGERPAGDITKIRSEDIPPHDIICGGFPCFVGNTLVLCKDGYKHIKDVMVGDEVLTHLGRFRCVTSTMKRDAAPLRMIKGHGVAKLLTTDEHPFFAMKYKSVLVGPQAHRKRIRKFGSPSWIQAKNIASCFVAQILPPAKCEDNHSNEFWKFVGLYLAEGWTVDRKDRKGGGRAVICGAVDEEESIRKMISDAGYHGCKVDQGSTVKFHICNNELYRFLKQFGKYAHGKTLPGFVLGLPSCKAKALLDGYLFGDGSREHSKKGGWYWKANTTSKKLAYGMALVTQRALGIIAQIRYVKRPRHCVICGRKVNQKSYYAITVPDINRSAFVKEGYGWKLIKKSKPAGKATVYNISVEEDESYVADGCIVHNCQPFSISGKQEGLKDQRGLLFEEIIRIAKFHKPLLLLLENVKNIKSHDKGRTIAEVKRKIKEAGYEPFSISMNASNYGVPQARERVFFVAFRKDVVGAVMSCPISPEKKVSLRSVLLPDDQASKYVIDVSEMSPQIDESPRIKQQEPINIGSIKKGRQGERVYHPAGHAITLSAGGGGIGAKTGLYFINGKVRRLAPRECARLMGLPESFAMSSDTQCYKQFGNGVVVDVVQHIVLSLPQELIEAGKAKG